MRKFLAFSLLFVSLTGTAAIETLTKALIINEVMQSAISGDLDKLMEYPDSWVELYNPTDKEVDLNGYYIGKDNDCSKCYNIQTGGGWGWGWGWGGGNDVKVPAKGYFVIYCDKENKVENSEVHTDFRLSNAKEGAVYLFDSNRKLVDSLHVPSMPAPDVAYGRATDGSDKLGYMLKPSRGKKNSGGLADMVLPEPVFSSDSRVVRAAANSGTEIKVAISKPAGTPDDAVIRYTLDGTEPTSSSKEYSGELSFSNTTTLKAALFLSGCVTPPASTRVFIFHGRDLLLPVISMVTPDKNLNDRQIGIIANNGSEAYKSENRKNWRRPVVMDYFPKGEEYAEFNQLCEIRVSGAYARMNAQKSFTVYADSRFGSKDYFNAQFWPYTNPDMYQSPSISLRNSGNDFNYSHIRDGVCQMLFGFNTDVDWQGFQPASVYINGKYYGILNIRERGNEDNVWMHYDYLEDITMLENPFWGVESGLKKGSAQQYYDLQSFINGNNKKLQEYEKRIDVLEYTNVMMASIYMSNTDFPGNNLVLWRPVASDGKWRWFLKDLDRSFGFWWKHGDEQNKEMQASGKENGKSSAQYLRWVLRDPANVMPNNYDANGDEPTRLFRNLMSIKEYQKMFFDRFTIYLGDFLCPDYINSVIDWAVDEIKEEMPYHKALYGGKITDWSKEINDMRKWAEERTLSMYGQLEEYYKAKGYDSKSLSQVSALINTDVDTPELYDITINDIPLRTHQFNGNLFSGHQYSVSAVSNDEDYEVIGWDLYQTDNGEVDHQTIMNPDIVLAPSSSTDDIYMNAILCATDAGLVEVDAERAVDIIYYNPQGIQSRSPFNGMNIVRYVYPDGTYTVSKRMMDTSMY